MDNRDKQKSVNWAIAGIGSGGLIVSVAFFDIVNLDTCRAHQGILTEGTLSTDLGTASAGPISYTTFRTNMPVSFEDFDGAAARYTTASLAIYSWGWLTLWDGPAYMSNVMAHMRMDGWSMAIPGGGFGHGLVKMIYGSGTPANVSALHCELNNPITNDPIGSQCLPEENLISQ